MVDLSVVLPAYNESRAIGSSIRTLSAYLDADSGEARTWRTWEILVVDDGSHDGTAETARRAAQEVPRCGERLRVIRHERNSGKGAAVRAGLLAARGENILVTDVDLSYAVQDLGCAAAALAARPDGAADGADLVTGDRRHPDSRVEVSLSAQGHVARRRRLSDLFNVIVRLGYGLPYKDTQCGLKGFKREAAAAIAARLRTRRFLADIEMFLIARALGMKVRTIPVHLTYLSGDSTVHVLNQSLVVLRDALVIKWTQIRGGYDAAER